MEVVALGLSATIFSNLRAPCRLLIVWVAKPDADLLGSPTFGCGPMCHLLLRGLQHLDGGEARSSVPDDAGGLAPPDHDGFLEPGESGLHLGSSMEINGFAASWILR
jgi:hypothetical protein